MTKWIRERFQPCIPLGENGTRITGCKSHRKLSYEAACEGAVLLKNNNGILPFLKGSKIVVFGKAQIDYVKGGGGSGDVNVSYIRNIYEGLKLRADRISVFDKLSLFYKDYVDKEFEKGGFSGDLKEPAIPDDLFEEATGFSDTAVITINRFSQEGIDRKNDESDSYFNLRKGECELVEKVMASFKHIVVLLNVGSMIDTSWFSENDTIEAAVMLWQGGMEGGRAAADIITGIVNPSGKLVDTFASRFEDYPSSAGYYESSEYVKYTEDVFVGYRYFETIPGKKKCVTYPFGYGLSYTEFNISDCNICKNDRLIFINFDVSNIGIKAGKEVVQIYYSAPAVEISKPSKQLCAFAKTKLLKPGEKQNITVTICIDEMASYDDMGQIQKSAYILERGVYNIFLGNSIRNADKAVFSFKLDENIIVKQLTQYCRPHRLEKRLLADGNYEIVDENKYCQAEFECEYTAKEYKKREENIMLADVAQGKEDIDDFISQLSDDELIHLVSGQPSKGVANTCGTGDMHEYGVPSVMTADGPAGIRINEECGVHTTAFPVATLLACTWNTDLVEQIGKAGAMEAKENNLTIWLTPALNIHRSPLCGRNFEYFSEDPLVSGKMAAAMVRGVESVNVVAVPKHFACNNKEDNRLDSDSVVSERAIREIYIKGFEICVKEAKPRIIMTSYNIINGVRASENSELLQGILRNEWKYEGMITSDWDNHAEHWKEIKAGNDLKMPVGDTASLANALADGKLTRSELAICAKRILRMILSLD